MKIVSWNVNGLRANHKKGFLSWFEKEKADIICLQEIKAQTEQLPEELVSPQGYEIFINSANKKGYSGVLVYSKIKPIRVYKKIGFSRFDDEGRYLRLDYGDFVLFNLYFPQGGREKKDMGYKLQTYEKLLNNIKRIKDRKVFLVGDFNIAHTEIDLARPAQNKKNTMFTPQERQQIDRLINLGFLDTFRDFNEEGENYTWWPYAYNARQRNLGWRIDYIFSSQKLKNKIKNAFIYHEILGSDHCPIGIEI